MNGGLEFGGEDGDFFGDLGTATALRSAGHLKYVQPGTAADVSYKS